MDAFRICGGKRLEGTVTVGGAKNAVLPMMAAALLIPGRTYIRRVPQLRDVTTMLELLEHLGARGGYRDHSFEIDASNLTSHEAPWDIVRKMRASVYALGPLLARLGKAKVSLPGGCAWGPRPVDLHVRGMELLGAEVRLEEGYIQAEAPAGGLRGARISFDISSVGATGNVLMAASLAHGTTVVENAAREPDIVALADFLNAAGARISGQGTATITIEGVPWLHPVDFENIPDRIEAGTYLAAAAITGGDVTLEGVRPDHLTIVLDRLRAMGAGIAIEDTRVRVFPADRDELAQTMALRGSESDAGRAGTASAMPVGSMGEDPAMAASSVPNPPDRRSGRDRRASRRLRSIDITTQPYPGFPTDLQAQFMALLCVAEGTGVITDTIYPDRFTHVPELHRLGADIRLVNNAATVRGVESLSGAHVTSTDIRASSALVLAGLVAKGETHVHRVYHIDRGYESIESRLRELGADIERYNVPWV